MATNPQESSDEVGMEWEEMEEHFKLDPNFGDIERGMNELLEDEGIHDFELSDRYHSLLKDSLEIPKKIGRAYLAAVYVDSERVTKSKAGDLFDVSGPTIRRAEDDLDIKRNRRAKLEEEEDHSSFFEAYSKEEVEAASDYIRNVPNSRVDEARKALYARRLGDALGVDEYEALVDPVRDSRFGDVEEIQRALSYLESELG